MALASLTQDDFSAGIYRGRKAPADSVYDAVNALVNDEGLLFKRGGSEYFSTSDAVTDLLAVYDDFLQVGQRVVVLGTGTSPGQIELSVITSTTPAHIGGITLSDSVLPRRAVGLGGMLVIPCPGEGPAIYAGSLKTGGYSAGTVTVTAGSKTVTGASTSWTANVDAGMIFDLTSQEVVGVVASVDSNTQITLRDPWGGSSAAGAGYVINPIYIAVPFDTIEPDHVAAVGTPPRLIALKGNRAYFSNPGAPTVIDLATDYHEFPQNAQGVGAVGVGDSLLAFTTAGVWMVSNMALDPIDAFGNVQHSVQQVSKDVILWGDLGLSAWEGVLVVPAVDDVYLFSPSGEAEPVTERIRPLYRSYVQAGYQPGLATVHRGHYLLPILNGRTLVDVLVCRLDRNAAWTRWSGHATGLAYAQRVATTARQPKLLGISGERVTDLTTAFDPTSDNAAEADATVHDLTVTTRDYPTGGNQHGFVKKIRARYECVDGGTPDPAVAVAFSSDQDAGSFTTLTDKGLQEGGSGWAASDGSKYHWAIVGKRRERIRFRLTVSGACASFVLRSLELLLRPTGRQ